MPTSLFSSFLEELPEFISSIVLFFSFLSNFLSICRFFRIFRVSFSIWTIFRLCSDLWSAIYCYTWYYLVVFFFQVLFFVSPFVFTYRTSTSFDKFYVCCCTPWFCTHQNSTRRAPRATACRRASTASTAQRNEPCTKQHITYYVCRLERERTASKQTRLPRGSRYVLLCRRASTALCHQKKQLTRSTVFIVHKSTCMELLAFTSDQFAPKMIEHLPTAVFTLCSILPCERV